MRDWKKLQPALNLARQNLDKNVALAELAASTEQSLFHAHRTLRVALGETPKQFTLRLRIDHAAAALVSSRASILDIALDCGFESHEAFCRAFRRRFGLSPSAYRKRGLIAPVTRPHADLVDEIGPCVGLYHIGLGERRSEEFMEDKITREYKITRQELAAQAVLVVRRRVRRAQIAATIGAALPKVFLYAQQRGLGIAGYPITRYLETSVGLVTLETGMRVTAPGGAWTVADPQGEVLAETLPGGPAAATIHFGPYDQLPEAYAAVEEWIAANGFRQNGAPWEAYMNSPADHPNPQDWKTEVFWPLQA
jgi:AraC-like DNA-binding protein/effector-binding domain-containing protein